MSPLGFKARVGSALLSIEWNSIRLSDREPQKLTKNCARNCAEWWYGELWCGELWCGDLWCGDLWCGDLWCGNLWYGDLWYGGLCEVTNIFIIC